MGTNWTWTPMHQGEQFGWLNYKYNNQPSPFKQQSSFCYDTSASSGRPIPSLSNRGAHDPLWDVADQNEFCKCFMANVFWETITVLAAPKCHIFIPSVGANWKYSGPGCIINFPLVCPALIIYILWLNFFSIALPTDGTHFRLLSPPKPFIFFASCFHQIWCFFPPIQIQFQYNYR